MVNEKLKRLNDDCINQSWQPKPDDYHAIAPEEERLNFRLNYSRLLDGKVCLVTGASDGMGYKIAEVYAQHGAKLIITARRREKLEAAAEEINRVGRIFSALSHHQYMPFGIRRFNITSKHDARCNSQGSLQVPLSQALP